MIETNDTRAEFILASAMQDVERFVVEKKGRFYSGYSHDLMNLDESASLSDCINQINSLGQIELSRNGLMRFLPEAMFCDEDCLLSPDDDRNSLKKRIEDLKKLKSSYETLFSGFDTIFFREEFRLMKTVSQLETQRAELLLDVVYGIKLAECRNRYVHDLALLRLNSRALKGAPEVLTFFVRAILGEQTELRRRQHNVCFVILIKGLDAESYRRKTEEYEEFFLRLADWFLPFDTQCDYCIKDRGQDFAFSDTTSPLFCPMILDYNTQFML